MKIINAAGIVPINAPNIGTNAVTPIIVLTSKAYGILKIVIPIKHNPPNITASIHWPVINLENLSCDILATSITLFALILSKNA